MNLTAVIFDMDGVIIDSEPYYTNTFRVFMKELGVDIEDEILYQLPGSSDEFEILKKTADDYTKEELRTLCIEKCNFDEMDYTDMLNPYIRFLLKALREKGIKIGIASSSSKMMIESMISQNHLENMFDVVMSGEMFKESKPNPEIYLTALKHLNVSATNAIAIEDSDYGILAAKRAGMKVIAKVDKRFGFKQDLADYYANDLFEAYLILMKEIEQ